MHPSRRHSDSPLSATELSTTEALAVVVQELRHVQSTLETQSRELSRLREAVRRPDRTVLYCKDLQREFGCSRSKVYQLWDSGLAWQKESGGRRYSTLAQVEAYRRAASEKK